MPLVVNLIFYLVHCAPRVEPRYPPEAPAGLADKIEKAPTEKRRRILAGEMERMGFTRVRFVSEAGLAEERPAAGTGPPVRSHWRRGHWRLQPHGPGLCLLKLLWIRPVLVNASAQDGPPGGRIYEVPAE